MEEKIGINKKYKARLPILVSQQFAVAPVESNYEAVLYCEDVSEVAEGALQTPGPFDIATNLQLVVSLISAGFDHLALHIRCPELGKINGATFICEACMAGQVVRDAFFDSDRQSHSLLIPLSVLAANPFPIISVAPRKGAGGMEGKIPPLIVSATVNTTDNLYASVAAKSIFVFSTARSGSTWLSNDILCGDENGRCLDEPGHGMLFAPIQWDAERFFDIANNDCYIPSGLDYETGRRERKTPRGPPIFERLYARLQGPAALFNPAYRSLLRRMIRTALIEHAIENWGLLNFERFVFKMPNESHAADLILDALPEARVIHLVRDGRDVMSSRFGAFASEVLSTTENVNLRLHAIAFYSHFWNFQNDIIAEARIRHDPDRVLVVRFEDLRDDLSHWISKLFRWIGKPLSGSKVRALCDKVDIKNVPPDEIGYGKRRGDGAIGRYRTVFSADEIDLMNRIMGPNLLKYKYENIDPLPGLGA